MLNISISVILNILNIVFKKYDIIFLNSFQISYNMMIKKIFDLIWKIQGDLDFAVKTNYFRNFYYH